MLFHPILYLISVDPSLGKFDKHSLSQETLMDMLIEGFSAKRSKIRGPDKNPRPLAKWKGVKFDEARVVNKIDWNGRSLGGTLELKYLPASGKEFYIHQNELSGTVDLTCLPDELEVLHLATNCFEGTVDLTMLPATMQRIYLSWNHFSGQTDFSQLPKSLQKLEVDNTNLEGEVVNYEGHVRLIPSGVKDMREN